MADHRVAHDKGVRSQIAERGQPAADQIAQARPPSRDAGHFPQDGERVVLGEVMEGQAAKGEVGALVAEGKASGVGLDEEHFLAGRRRFAREAQGLGTGNRRRRR